MEYAKGKAILALVEWTLGRMILPELTKGDNKLKVIKFTKSLSFYETNSETAATTCFINCPMVMSLLLGCFSYFSVICMTKVKAFHPIFWSNPRCSLSWAFFWGLGWIFIWTFPLSSVFFHRLLTNYSFFCFFTTQNHSRICLWSLSPY